MIWPALEYEITQEKKRAAMARELARNGYCYFELRDNNNQYLITEIFRMSFGDYRTTKLHLNKSKRYRVVTSFWNDVKKIVLEQHQDDIELDNPTLLQDLTY